MSDITFYRQCRFDGGVRTGIDVDGTLVYAQFHAGEEYDPRLCWFVDLRCKGQELPISPPRARKWLIENAAPIKEAFRRFADETGAGIDVGLFSWEVANAPAGVEMKIVYSATRRVDGREMADVVRDIGSNWESYLRSLKPFHATRSR